MTNIEEASIVKGIKYRMSTVGIDLIVESCFSGGGLRSSEYEIDLKTSKGKAVKKENKQVFRIKVRPGSPSKDEVWIVGC